MIALAHRAGRIVVRAAWRSPLVTPSRLGGDALESAYPAAARVGAVGTGDIHLHRGLLGIDGHRPQRAVTPDHHADHPPGHQPGTSGADPTVLLTSALWVANGGAALGLYAAVFATVVAWAEHRYGTPRIILIGAAGHVLGSLLTAAILQQAIDSGYLSDRLARTADVGVSYVLVAGVAAAIVLGHGWHRTAGAAVLAAALLIPLAVNRTIWDLGHVLAALCGLAAAVVLLAVAPARAGSWRQPPCGDLDTRAISGAHSP